MRAYHKLSREKHDEICRLYTEDKKLCVEIASIFDVSQTWIHKVLTNRGIQIENRRGFYNVDEGYFSNIDTPSKAYTLGLFFADGTNLVGSQIRIYLQKRDERILELIREDMKYEGSLRHAKRQKENRQDQTGLCITSKVLSLALEKLGAGARKSYNLKYPVLQDDMHSHFIRGFFDGDGCVYESNRCSVSFVGTKDMCEGIREILNKQTKIKSYVNEHKSIYRLLISNIEGVQEMMTYMYRDAGEFRLGRKYEKFIDIFERRQWQNRYKIICEDTETGDVYKLNNLTEIKGFFKIKNCAGVVAYLKKNSTHLYLKKYKLRYQVTDTPGKVNEDDTLGLLPWQKQQKTK